MHASTPGYSTNIPIWLLLFTISVSGPFSTLVTASAYSSEHRTTNINSTGAPEADQHARVIQSFAKLPLSFEINQGQVDKRVSFLSHGSGYDLFLMSNEAVLFLNVPSAQQPSTASSMRSKNLKTDPPTHTKQDVLRMKLMGANSTTHVTGLDELPGKSNYLLGNDPKQWRTNVAHYAKVKYQAVYPGIDLIYYGREQQLEYDFIVAPGAEPSAIRQEFEGAQSVDIGATGNLVLRTSGGEVHQRKPFI